MIDSKVHRNLCKDDHAMVTEMDLEAKGNSPRSRLDWSTLGDETTRISSAKFLIM